MLGHELTHIRNGDVRMLVIAVDHRGRHRLLRRTAVPDGVPGRLALGRRPLELRRQRPRQGRRRHCHRHRHRAGRGGVAALGGDPLRAVAKARISRRRRLGRTDQGPRRHDLGAAQDRRPRRTAKAQPPRSWKCASTTRARASPTCSPPIRRSKAGSPRWSSSPAATIPARSNCPSEPRTNRSRTPSSSSSAPGPWGGDAAAAQAVPAGRAACHTRRRSPPGQRRSAGPLGPTRRN